MNKKFCLICGKEINEKRTYCSRHCQVIAQHKNGCHTSPFKQKEIQDKIKKTNLERYGVENVFQIKENRDKGKTPEKIKQQQEHCKETMQKRYGVERNSQIPEVKDKISKKLHNKESNIKRKNSFQLKYGTDNYLETEDFLLKRKYWEEENKEKEYITKKKNNTFNSSKSEIEIYEKLIEKFSKEDIEWQYRSEKYPFNCDFYIKSLNLYIEYQGNWTHGKEPFNENNKEHLELIENWKQRSKEINWKGKHKKFYNIAINTWTKSDPNKRRIVKENELNWIEFFSMKEFYNWYNNLI